MADRDWDRELADIDRRLASVPEAAAPPPAGQRAAAPAAPAPRAAAPAGPARPAAGAPAAGGRTLGTAATAPGRRSWRSQFALLARILAGAAVVAALIYWPYPSACGAGLGVYLALVAALGLAGVATSTTAWRHRAPFVHVLGLAMIASAAVLGAREVLPRVGYAVPTPGVPATWACPVTPATPAAPSAAPVAPAAGG
jgi:hypothetical protein